MELGVKWVHMAQYELISKLYGALWPTIVSKTPLTPRRAINIKNRSKNYFFSRGGHQEEEGCMMGQIGAVLVC